MKYWVAAKKKMTPFWWNVTRRWLGWWWRRKWPLVDYIAISFVTPWFLTFLLLNPPNQFFNNLLLIAILADAKEDKVDFLATPKNPPSFKRLGRKEQSYTEVGKRAFNATAPCSRNSDHSATQLYRDKKHLFNTLYNFLHFVFCK